MFEMVSVGKAIVLSLLLFAAASQLTAHTGGDLAPSPTARIACILLPTGPEPAQRYAAEALRQYIAEMTGCEPLAMLGQSDSRPPGRVLIVGRTAKNLQRHCPDDWPTDPDTNGSAWQDICVDASWTDQGFAYHGVAWHVTDFTLSAPIEGQLWILREQSP